MEGENKMTREEQIKKQANIYIGHPQDLEEDICITNMRNDFIEGAKWADEHPNIYNDEKYHIVKVSCLDELNRKAVLYDTFLEKACEWLLDNTGKYIIVTGGGYWFNDIEFIKDFKQAMEK